MKKKLFLSLFAILLITGMNAQGGKLWTVVSEQKLSSQEKVVRDSNPTDYKLYTLD
ncbi:hypothetical protein [Flavobacterium sp. '19STA2R22 D10 B1']|uniref:hypothetical protein n=1 Tax=Flavobacterium aerium TaxID=3037261 RepID=UPI00278BD0E9|nr:hypothetical protein [Flavobacterium sp. '19STA2R22 D10 B1']